MPLYSQSLHARNSISKRRHHDEFASESVHSEPSARHSVVGVNDVLNIESLFDRLPIELRVEIFYHCLNFDPLPRFEQNEAPQLLTRVCRSWRALAISTPKLWSSFEIQLRGSGVWRPSHERRLTYTLKSWLERSRNYPLSIQFIQDPTIKVSITNSHCMQLLVLLMPHAHRWRNVHFLISSSCFIQIQKYFTIPEDLPALRSFSLALTALWDTPMPLKTSSLGIPWTQLASLDLQPDVYNLPTLDDCLEILSQAKNLSRCTFRAYCSMMERRGEGLSLPKLDSLHLVLHSPSNPIIAAGFSGSPESALAFFLDCIQPSRLRVLRIEGLVQWNDRVNLWSETHSHFTSFLRYVSPTLDSLRLAYLPINEGQIIDCLEQLPLLSHLDLRFSLADVDRPISDRLLNALTSQTSNGGSGIVSEGSLLPRIQSIHLQCHGEACSAQALVALISSRQTEKGNASDIKHISLKRFRFISMKPVLEDVLKRIQEWKRTGLDVVIDSVIVR